VLHKLTCLRRDCCNPKHLYTGTHKQNMSDMAMCGSKKGKWHHKVSLTDEKVLEIRHKYLSGPVSQNQLSKEYGVAKSTIEKIVLGYRWKHLPCPVSYAEFHTNNNMTAGEVRQVRKLLGEGYKVTEVSKLMGVGYHSVYRIKQGTSWGKVL